MERYWLAVLVVTFLALSSVNGAAFIGPGTRPRSDPHPDDIAAAQIVWPLNTELGSCTCCCLGGPGCYLSCFCPLSCHNGASNFRDVIMASK